MSDRISQTRFWLIVAVATALALWALKPMLLPFVAGMAIAYFLNPVVNGLGRLRFPRWLGTLAALLGFVLFVVALLLLILPLLESQMGALLDSLPGYLETARANLLPIAKRWLARLSPDDMGKLQEAAGGYVGNAVGWAAGVLKGLISGGLALFDVLTLLVITPIVAFYLLRDWPRLVGVVDRLLPRRHYETIRKELTEIDRTLSGFLRGQALVCLCLGLFYSVGLTAVGLDYGATIGILAGVLSFIPYVGSTFGGVSSLALAFLKFDDGLHIGLVAAVFLLGQALEGYVLTPKLVGDRVGLHPVWILFALFAGGSLMGFTGVLIAVPVAAVVGVLVRFAVRRYKASEVYRHGDAL